jgi:hypothetical protein
MRIFKAAVLVAGVLAFWHGAAAAWAQPQCTDMGGSVDQGAPTCRIHVVTDKYKIDVSYPTDYPDQQGLTDYLNQTRDGFVNVSQMPGSRNLPYQLEIDSDQFRSARPPHTTQSVALKIFQDVGGARPETWYKGFNYDVDAHRPITFDTLFVPGAKPLDTIFPIVQRELERQVGANAAISTGDGLDPAHYQNFAITDDDLIFYFGQGELLPATAGANVVHVPRTAIAQILA